MTGEANSRPNVSVFGKFQTFSCGVLGSSFFSSFGFGGAAAGSASASGFGGAACSAERRKLHVCAYRGRCRAVLGLVNELSWQQKRRGRGPDCVGLFEELAVKTWKSAAAET